MISADKSKESLKINMGYMLPTVTVGGIYLVIMYVIFGVSLADIFRFVLLNIFSIFLPGHLISSFIHIGQTYTERWCLYYAVGYATVIGRYFLAALAGDLQNAWIVEFLFVISILIMLIEKGKRQKERGKWQEDKTKEKIEFIIISLMLLVNVFVYAGRYLSTDVIPVLNISRDMQYWTNNTVALKLAWPPDNLFFAESPLYYHYFSGIPTAYFSRVYGIDVFTLSFPLYAMTKAILMTGGVQYLINAAGASRHAFILGNILLLSTTGAEAAIHVTYYAHILLSPFGFDIGFAYGAFFVAFLIHQFMDKNFNGGLFVGVLLSWCMCVGAKMPVAAALILFAACICLYWLMNKCWKSALGYGLMILFSFFLIGKYCVGMFSVVSGASDYWEISFYSGKDIMYFGSPAAQDPLCQIIARIGEKNLLLAIIVRCLFINPAAFFGMLVSIINVLIMQLKGISISKNTAILYLSLGITVVWGVGLGILINAGGHSEMYFSMAALIPMAVMPLLVFGENDGNTMSVSAFYRVPGVIFMCLLAAGVCRFWISAHYNAVIADSVVAVKRIYDAKVRKVVEETDGIRKTDVEALHWLKDHAASNAMIMSDKAVVEGNIKYYMYGIFCERQQYLEGSDMLEEYDLLSEKTRNELYRRKDLIRNVYENMPGAIEQAKMEGIDYIVQTVDITPQFRYDESLLEIMADTETMNIYRIR